MENCTSTLASMRATAKEPVSFAAGADRPLMVFAGIWTTWTSVRKAREGEVTVDCFGLRHEVRLGHDH